MQEKRRKWTKQSRKQCEGKANGHNPYNRSVEFPRTGGMCQTRPSRSSRSGPGGLPPILGDPERDSRAGVSGTGRPRAAGPRDGCGRLGVGRAASPAALPRIPSHRGCGAAPGTPGPRVWAPSGGATRWRSRGPAPECSPAAGWRPAGARAQEAAAPSSPAGAAPRHGRCTSGRITGAAASRTRARPAVAKGGSSRGARPARPGPRSPGSASIPRPPPARRQRRPPHLGPPPRAAPPRPPPRPNRRRRLRAPANPRAAPPHRPRPLRAGGQWQRSPPSAPPVPRRARPRRSRPRGSAKERRRTPLNVKPFFNSKSLSQQWKLVKRNGNALTEPSGPCAVGLRGRGTYKSTPGKGGTKR